MQRRLTQQIVRTYIRMLGGSFAKTDYDDFRVRFNGEDYFTDSLEDALGTAAAMAGSHVDFPAAESFLRENGF